MSKNWYLISSQSASPNYQDNIIEDYVNSFNSILNTEIAVKVELYAQDLSKVKALNAILINRVQDTKLQALNRLVLVPVGTCKAGMYIKYKDRFWLITNIVDDNKVYEKAIISFCNWELTWVNEDGLIIKRWANITSASQYNNGETAAKNYDIRSDQLMIVTTNDEECQNLQQGQRFIIDSRCKLYEKKMSDLTKSDTHNPVITYQLTRSDFVLYDYLDGGNIQFIATQDEQQKNDGYYYINSEGCWICDVPNPNKTTILSSEIECDEPCIYIGLEPGIFTAKFYDNNGNIISVEPSWNITSDFKDKLSILYDKNSVLISTANQKLINKSFLLTLDANGYKSTTLEIKIKAFI